jgi:hypothetical protein
MSSVILQIEKVYVFRKSHVTDVPYSTVSIVYLRSGLTRVPPFLETEVALNLVLWHAILPGFAPPSSCK